MLFTDPLFLVCLVAVMILYHLLPRVLRPYYLLAVSMAFYASWGIEQMIYIVFAALVGWLFALLIGAAAYNTARGTPVTGGRKHLRRLLLMTGILLLIAAWMFGKYGEMLLDYLKSSRFPIPIIVPLGISYYTLSVIGYLADVYLRNIQPEKNPLRFLMFLFYFPKILQGPIENYRTLGEQVCTGHKVDYRSFCFGAQLFLFGMFKKLLIADRLAVGLVSEETVFCIRDTVEIRAGI